MIGLQWCLSSLFYYYVLNLLDTDQSHQQTDNRIQYVAEHAARLRIKRKHATYATINEEAMRQLRWTYDRSLIQKIERRVFITSIASQQ